MQFAPWVSIPSQNARRFFPWVSSLHKYLQNQHTPLDERIEALRYQVKPDASHQWLSVISVCSVNPVLPCSSIQNWGHWFWSHRMKRCKYKLFIHQPQKYQTTLAQVIVPGEQYYLLLHWQTVLSIIFKLFSSILGSWRAFRFNLEEPLPTGFSPKLPLWTAVADLPCSTVSVPRALKKPTANPPAVSSKDCPWQFVQMLMNSDTSPHYRCCLGEAEGSSVILAWTHAGGKQYKEGLSRGWP